MKNNGKKSVIVISGIAVLAVIAMVIAVSGTTHLICPGSGIITNVSVKNNGTGGLVVPGQTYMSHNITIEDNSTEVNVTVDWYTKVMYFNITGYNGTIINDDITNITIYNESGNSIFGFNNTITGNDSVNITALTDMWVNNTAINFSVNITINTTGLIDGRNLSPNVTLGVQQYNSSSGTFNCSNTSYANDTAPETIEVLNATNGSHEQSAWEGNKNVLCANVTIIPGNDSVPNYLKAITFNTTAATTINPAYIESFRLWNDTNANKTFDAADALINSSSPTEGTNNVSFNLSTEPLNNRTIPAGQNGTFFLTMNLTKPGIYTPVYRTVIYQAQILPQGITINQTAIGEGNTGNSSATTFTSLGVHLIARVPEFNTIGLIAFIGILSVVLAVVTLRRKR